MAHPVETTPPEERYVDMPAGIAEGTQSPDRKSAPNCFWSESSRWCRYGYSFGVSICYMRNGIVGGEQVVRA